VALNVGYCPRCGKLFSRSYHEVCANCVKEIEEQYTLCRDYLKENKYATLSQLSEETGVPMKQILKFIREGRLATTDAPNITYPCESCGTPIREHYLCPNCRDRLAKKISRVQQDIGNKPSRSDKESHEPAFRFKGHAQDGREGY